MLIIHLLCALFGMFVCLMTIPSVFALGFGKLVDLATDEASQEFFSECVGNGLA